MADSDKDTNYLFKLRDGLWLKIPKGRTLSLMGMAADRAGDLLKGDKVEGKRNTKMDALLRNITAFRTTDGNLQKTKIKTSYPYNAGTMCLIWIRCFLVYLKYFSRKGTSSTWKVFPFR